MWVLKYLVQELDWQKITHAILSVGPVRDFSCMVLPRVIAARLPSEEFPSTIIRTALLALRDDEDQEGTVSCAACVLVKSILGLPAVFFAIQPPNPSFSLMGCASHLRTQTLIRTLVSVLSGVMRMSVCGRMLT